MLHMMIGRRSGALHYCNLIVLPFVQDLLIRTLLWTNMTMLIIEKRGILVVARLARIIFSAKRFKVAILSSRPIERYLIIHAYRRVSRDHLITFKSISGVAGVQPVGWLLVSRGELRRYIHLFTFSRALHFYFPVQTDVFSSCLYL